MYKRQALALVVRVFFTGLSASLTVAFLAVFFAGLSALSSAALRVRFVGTSKSVSYTHLGAVVDGVAQAAGLADDGRCAVAAGHHLCQTAGLAPVSYTHLDVYKRQGYNSFLIGFSAQAPPSGELPPSGG